MATDTEGPAEYRDYGHCYCVNTVCTINNRVFRLITFPGRLRRLSVLLDISEYSDEDQLFLRNVQNFRVGIHPRLVNSIDENDRLCLYVRLVCDLPDYSAWRPGIFLGSVLPPGHRRIIDAVMAGCNVIGICSASHRLARWRISALAYPLYWSILQIGYRD